MVREGLITQEYVQIVKYTHRYLNPLPADKFIAEVMTRDVIAISSDESVFQAWKKMLENRVKAMPVIDRFGSVVGILTDEGLLDRAGIQQRLSVAIRMEKVVVDQEHCALESSGRIVEDVMSHPAVTVSDTDTLGIATTQMAKSGLKRLPVVNKDRKLVGMLSRSDILREVAQTEPVAHEKDQSIPHAGRLVHHIMTTDIPMVNQDEDLSSIIEKFARSDSHRLIVVDTQGKAIGPLSDTDVVARVQPSKRKNILEALRSMGKPAPGKETAFDLMSPGPLTAPPDLPVVDAVKKMLAESRKWLVVMDENSKPLGLVDRQMLLEAVMDY